MKKLLVLEMIQLLEQVEEKAEEIAKKLDVESGTEIEQAENLYLVRMCENVMLDYVPTWGRDFRRTMLPRQEGRLWENESGRYCIGDFELTSGSSIELFVDDKLQNDYGWNFGRIEHRTDMGGYYFYNETGNQHYQLLPGMTAAIRKK